MGQKQRVFSLFLLSPSSRRAWIEISVTSLLCILPIVALLAEGVDRNLNPDLHSGVLLGRPPRGGRG